MLSLIAARVSSPRRFFPNPQRVALPVSLPRLPRPAALARADPTARTRTTATHTAPSRSATGRARLIRLPGAEIGNLGDGGDVPAREVSKSTRRPGCGSHDFLPHARGKAHNSSSDQCATATPITRMLCRTDTQPVGGRVHSRTCAANHRQNAAARGQRSARRGAPTRERERRTARRKRWRWQRRSP